MLKPEFNPLFYSFLTYGFKSADKPDAVSISIVGTINVSSEVKQYRNILKDRIKVYSEKASSSIKDVKANLKYKNETVTKEISSISSTHRTLMLSYKSKIRTCKTKAEITSLEAKLKLDFSKLTERIKLIEKADKNKGKLIQALEKNTNKIQKHYEELYENNNIDHNKVEKKHLDMLLNAYLLRIFTKNARVIEKLGAEKVNTLVLTLQDGEYVNGPIVDDFEYASAQIEKAIRRWEQDKPRDVYKNSNWDTKYENRVYGSMARLAVKKLFGKTDAKRRYSRTPISDTLSEVSEELGIKLSLSTMEGLIPPLSGLGKRNR